MALGRLPFDLSAPGSVICDGRVAEKGMRIARFGQRFTVAASPRSSSVRA